MSEDGNHRHLEMSFMKHSSTTLMNGLGGSAKAAAKDSGMYAGSAVNEPQRRVNNLMPHVSIKY